MVGIQVDDDLLYHYTGVEGLHGILSTNKLWATDIRHLNDTQEVKQGVDRIVERLERDDIVDDLALTGKAVVIDSLRTWKDSHPPIYVACFCEKSDLLSQWRGYGAGQGYAIGFERDGLNSLPSVSGYESFVRKAIYDVRGDAEVEAQVTAVARAQVTGGGGSRHSAWLARRFFIASYKHAAFSEECEWP